MVLINLAAQANKAGFYKDSHPNLGERSRKTGENGKRQGDQTVICLIFTCLVEAETRVRFSHPDLPTTSEARMKKAGRRDRIREVARRRAKRSEPSTFDRGSILAPRL